MTKLRMVIFGQCDSGFKEIWLEEGYEVSHERILKSDSSVDLFNTLNKYDEGVYVFTFDYYPALAEACNKHKDIYISWVWDSPHLTLWSKTAKYDTNRIFLFDREQYRRLCESGVNNIYHLPLSTNIDEFGDVISKDAGKSKEKFTKDVVFVGNLYNSPQDCMYDRISYLPDYIRGYFDALMASQMKLWGADIIDNSISEEIGKEIRNYIKLDIGDGYENDIYEMMVKDIIKKKISQLERLQMCSVLSRICDFSLYTGSDTSYDSKIKNLGRVDYVREMPLIFNYSKINIHITVRSITSGIPQRVLDVLACEGFLLTNYQPEIVEYFQDGEDLVIYEDFEDMCNKVIYYLNNDEERKQIAHNGYLKVKEMFSYRHQFDVMTKCI